MSDEVKALKVVLKNREGVPVLPMIETTDRVEVGSSIPVTAGGVRSFLDTWKPNGASGGGVGRQIGDIFHHISGTPPLGALALDGAVLESCDTVYPQFWAWLREADRNALRYDIDTYNKQVADTGVCLGFVVNGSNVKLPTWTPGIPVTSKLKVKGTGKTLGLTDGSKNYAMYEDADNKYVNLTKDLYDVAAGTKSTRKNNANNTLGIGVTTDADKSGMVVTGAPTSACGIYCIHVYDEVTPSSALDADAFTANVERLIAEMRLHANVNLTNVTGVADFVVESERNDDGSWYRLYRSGWIEQGGWLPDPGSSSAYAAVTFKKAMKDVYYCPSITHTSTTDTGTMSPRDVACINPSPGGMTIRQFASDKDGTYWKVEGMAAEKPQWGTVNA